MKKIIFVLFISFSFLLSGCASSGNQKLRKETEQSVKEKITEKKTTRTEIKTLFGSPDSTSFTDGGKEIWKYEFVDISNDAINYIPFVNLFGSSSSGIKKELVIMFDNDIVQRYSMSESAHAVRTGLFK